MRRLDLVGRRFERLTVIDFAGVGSDIGKIGFQSSLTYWRVQCDCGSTLTVSGAHLTAGHTTSCGCRKREQNRARGYDLTGKTFGRLVALHRDGIGSWLCAPPGLPP